MVVNLDSMHVEVCEVATSIYTLHIPYIDTCVSPTSRPYRSRLAMLREGQTPTNTLMPLKILCHATPSNNYVSDPVSPLERTLIPQASF